MSFGESKQDLKTVLEELIKTKGIEGALIINPIGEVIEHLLKTRGDVSIFGPMAQVIDSSSQRLLGSAGLGKMEKVLLESKKGKSLFLQLEKVHLIILIEKKANLGMIMRSAHKMAPFIIDLTKDLEIEVIEPEDIKVDTEQKDISEDADIIEPKPMDSVIELETSEEIINDPVEPLPEPRELDEPEIIEELEPIKVPVEETPPEVIAEEIEIEEVADVEEEIEEPEGIPSIKPPISLPDLPESVVIPTDDEKRSKLLLEIYGALFMAMAIGASKIMGVSPARGLIKQFLPFQDCKELLNNVDVKSNAALDFEQINKNADNIPINERENIFIKDFSHMMTVITDNYGRVMGYDAFRGMVRTEFRKINSSYGKAMQELGVMDNMHPELKKLLS